MDSYFGPRQKESAEALALDMQSLALSGSILPFGAKLSVDHVFRSSEKSTVEVVYSFPLPRDASLCSFQISGPGFCISSRLERTKDAQNRYEEAIEAGSLAAFTQQNLDGLVNLTVGNIRSGETVAVRLDLVAGVSLSDEGFRFRFPFTVAPCYHALMRVASPRPGVGIIELPRAISGDVFFPSFHQDASRLHTVGFDLRVAPARTVREISAPSHAIGVGMNENCFTAKLCADREMPNRDLVLDVKQHWGTGVAWADRRVNGRKHFAVVAPSIVFGEKKVEPRRVVFLLDRSGSMAGEPMVQARRALELCIAPLAANDSFGIVAFDNSVQPFSPRLLPATRENVEGATEFLAQVDARGGTELALGVESSAQLLNGEGGDIFVLTDGQVSDTSEILQRIRRAETRLFCLGIGSASQDRFLELLARQTGGVCRFVTPSERIDEAALELFSAMGGVVAPDVKVKEADTEPGGDARVFSGTPFFALGEIDAEASAALLKWNGGSRAVAFEDVEEDLHGLIEKLRGARAITDAEATLDKADAKARRKLADLSKRYGLASSEMSLVAVVERAHDKQGEVPKTKIVPVGMPQGTEFGAYFNEIMPMLGSSKAPVGGQYARAGMRIHAEESCGKMLPSLADHVILRKSKARLHISPPDIKITESELEAAAGEAIMTIDRRERLCRRKDAHLIVRRLRRALASGTNLVGGEIREALQALINFLSSDLVDLIDAGGFDETKWTLLKDLLNAAWPALGKDAWEQRPYPSKVPIRPGISREDSLHIFKNSVNQKGVTMFSTDHWLAPKLEQLRTLLSDPITTDEALTLLDVLHNRRSMHELIGWLESPYSSWRAHLIFSSLYDRSSSRGNLVTERPT